MDQFELPKRERKAANIDIAPMLDMVFILLIFFIVTSSFTRETGVDVTKPQAKSASEVNKENIMIAITREGTVHVNERQVDLITLKDVLGQMISKNPDREVILIADQDSNTGAVVNVIDVCNLTGVKKVSIAALSK
ncbi:MAG: biopolymer transporter ExbD [Fibrobacterales bacterium]